MEKIINLFGEPYDSPPKSKEEKIKRNWQDRFQRWSNIEFENSLTSRGKCGYGVMCDYCEDNTHGRPCVRALNMMLREKQLSIDYSNADFLQVWNGSYWKYDKSKFASSETADNSKIEIERFIKG